MRPQYQLNLFDTCDVLPINQWRHPSQCPLNPQQWELTLKRKAAADAAHAAALRAARNRHQMVPTLEQI
jgi:hypothetical protein